MHPPHLWDDPERTEPSYLREAIIFFFGAIFAIIGCAALVAYGYFVITFLNWLMK